MTRADLFWVAYLYLLSCHREEQINATNDALFRLYSGPRFDRLEALSLRPSPLLERMRGSAGAPRT